MKGRTLVVNAVVAALYFVITLVVAPIGFLNIQFRLSELFNHLIVYNKRYFFGIVLGVVIANLVLSPTKADLVFGVGHTVVSLLITMWIGKYVKDEIKLMIINTFVFSFNMFIIAYMLKVFVGLTDGFFFLWFTLGISELVTMGIAIVIVYFLNKRISFGKIV